MRSSLAWVPALVAAAAWAGCITDDPPTGTDDAGPGAEEASPPAASFPSVGMVGCRQYHAFFPSPAAAFAGSVPDGFGLVTSDPAGQSVDVGVGTSVCAEAWRVDGATNTSLGPVGEMWTTLPVTPPPEFRADDVIAYLVPIHGFASSPALADVYVAGGMSAYPLVGEVGLEETLSTPAAIGGRATASSGAEAFEIAGSVRPDPREFHAGVVRLFVVRDATVTGWFTVSWQRGLDVGLGTAVFTAQADPATGPPPATAGLVHQVADVPVRMVYGQAPVAG